MRPRAEVIASPTKILMHSSASRRDKKRLKLVNQSKVTAKFMFDIAPSKCIIFQPDLICGSIRSNSCATITITFTPTEQKIYYFPLTCLILHQAPIIIELYGYCEIQFIQQDHIALELSQLNMGLTTFEMYFNVDKRIKKKDETHVLSLSQNYFVFEKTSTLNPCQTNSVTNHTAYELVFELEKDINEIFVINPRKLRIRGGKSGHFQISFGPLDERGGWYIRDVVAHGTVKSPRVTHTFASIRLMGYWTPYKIAWSNNTIGNKKRMKMLVNNGKNIITLPPCTPGASSYTTFLIRNDSTDPLTFQFISPYSDDSISPQFTVKPMLGILSKRYQIVAVRMFPNALNEYLCSERWSIKFNENSDIKSFVYIEFQGLVERPKLCIGNDNNEIKFGSVHPGCQTVRSVSIKNLTRHSIRYVFSHLPSYIILDKLSNDICGHEIHSLSCTFCPSQPGVYECNILCTITALGEFAGTEKPIEMRVHIWAMSAIGSLKAESDNMNFIEVPYNEMRKFSFYVFNPSDVEICFKLMSKSLTGETRCEEALEFHMHPMLVRLLPTERQEIIASLVPRKVGFFKFLIMYSINELQNPTAICTMSYTCILPVIKIVDVQYHQINPNFGKLTLWRLFKINLLNKIIMGIEPNMRRTVDIYIPQIAISDNSSIVKFLVENKGSVPIFWCIKKIMTSSTGENININSHLIYPKSGTVQPKERAVMTIQLSQALNCKQCQWCISLGHDRQVVITVDHSSRLLYGPNFILDAVYLGDPYPKYQSFWLFNPTLNDLIWSIDTRAFNPINSHHRSDYTLTCVEPVGSIPAQMLHPILVKFQPRRLGDFTILIPIIVGEMKTRLIMKGRTSLIYQPMKIPRELLQSTETFHIPEVPVYMSTDIIILSNASLCSRVTRTITLSNRSESEVFGYEWKHYKIIDVIYLRVMPQKGRIQPLSTRSFELIIEIGNKPFQIDANICCQIINYTAKRIHWRLIDMYEMKIAEVKEQFTIEKEGTNFSMLEYSKNLPNPPAHFYRVLTVCCIASHDITKAGNIPLNALMANIVPTVVLNIAFETVEAVIWNILYSGILEYIMHKTKL